MRKVPRKKRDGQTRSRFDRALAITLISAMGLLVILGLVFSIAQGSQQITTRASQLHNADESLRAATVVRAQLGLAVYLTRIDDTYGTNSQTAIDVSVQETRTALDDLATGVSELESNGMHDVMAAIEAAGSYSAATADVLTAIEDRNAALAADLWQEHDAEFQSLVGNLEGIRDVLRDEVNRSDVFLGRIGTLTRFLVAFLVPAAVIFIYRELLLRQHRQTELEGRLESERRLSRAREEFIANASHELRTPLTGISGLAQILAEDPTIADSDSASELLHLIISESNDLSRMVEDLLTTARLDAGALHFDFDELSISEVVSDVAEPLVRAGLSVEWECEPAFVKGDALRTRQVLRNLLSNARKYGGPHIWVRGRIDGRTYTCEVIDDGDGVPDHISDRVFERFVHRGHTGVKDSVGLGLAIVHALAQGMGGSVRYERHDGNTVFTVRLPLAEEATEFHSAVAAAVQSQRLIDEQIAAEG
jgi:signal transduction histidine kinase